MWSYRSIEKNIVLAALPLLILMYFSGLAWLGLMYFSWILEILNLETLKSRMYFVGLVGLDGLDP